MIIFLGTFGIHYLLWRLKTGRLQLVRSLGVLELDSEESTASVQMPAILAGYVAMLHALRKVDHSAILAILEVGLRTVQINVPCSRMTGAQPQAVVQPPRASTEGWGHDLGMFKLRRRREGYAIIRLEKAKGAQGAAVCIGQSGSVEGFRGPCMCSCASSATCKGSARKG